MKKKSTLWKRVVSGLLCGVMTVSVAYQSVVAYNTINPIMVEAASSAKSRVETFIGLAAGKSSVASSDLASLTQEELKFLGVYCSNFYNPFDTELGDDDGIMGTQKANMVGSLKSGLNFNDEVAETLVDTIVGLSRSNNKKLEFRVSKEYQPSAQNAYKPVKDFEVNYWTFMNSMMGTFFGTDGTVNGGGGSLGYPWMCPSGLITNNSNGGVSIPLTYIANVPGISKESLRKLAYSDARKQLGMGEDDGNGYMYITGYSGPSGNVSWDYSDLLVDSSGNIKYDYGYFGYTDSTGNFIPVFDCTLYGDLAPTASMVAFAECMMSSDISKGLGLTLFDFTDEELSGDKVKALRKELGNYDPSLLVKFSAYGIPMYVDCFGNIFSSGANHQRVIVPACINPYTWVEVQPNGTLGAKGKNIQLISLPALSAVKTGNFVSGLSVGESTSGNFKSVSNLGGLMSEGATTLKETLLGLVFATGYKLNTSNSTGFNNLSEDAKNTYIDNYMYAVDSSNKEVMYNYDGVKSKIASSAKIGTESYKDESRVEHDVIVKGDFAGFGNVQSGSEYGYCAVDNTRYAWSLFRGDSDRKADDSWGNGGKDYKEIIEALETAMGYASNNPWMYLSVVDGYVGLKGLDGNGTANRLKNGIFSGDQGTNVVNNQVLGCRPKSQSVGLKAFNKTVIIDDLGAFGWDTSNSSVEYSAIQVQNMVSADGNTSANLDYNFVDGNPCFGSSRNDAIDSAGKIQTSGISQQAAVCLYTTYAIAGLTDTSSSLSSSDLATQLGFVLNNEFPDIVNAPLNIPSSTVDKMINNDIRNWIYYLLHPTEGKDYVKILISNKVNALLLDWHAKMVGTKGMGIMTGSTYYRSNIGYVTIPDLAEVQWTAKIVDFFYSIIPLLIIFMVVSMVLAFALGILSWQRAIIACILFSVTLFIPINAINGVIELSNIFSTRIYGDKFTYWAVIQEETYGSALDTAASGESYENYLKTLYATNDLSQGSESIVLKWQAPKKMASLMLSSKDSGSLKNVRQSALLNSTVLGGAFSNEAYMDGDSQYLFRGYSDIANFSRFIYNRLNATSSLTNGAVGSQSISEYTNRYGKRLSVNPLSESGYGVYGNKTYSDAGYTGAGSRLIRVYAPTGADELYAKKAVAQLDVINKGTVNSDTKLGINQNNFKFSVALFNQYDTFSGGDKRMYTAIKDGLQSYEGEPDDADDKAYASLAAYGLMSESPFYYYSWRLYDAGMNAGSLAYGGYKTLLLSDSDGGFFYNTKTNGELKDFMDMRSLFTYIIPYLKLGNDTVRAYDEKYGITYYEGIPSEENKGDTLTGEDKYKYLQNRNVARLYEMYTPWVDLMYDCSYAKPETITVLGDKYTVEDPIDPLSYPGVEAGRPMIFSESEMYDFGLTTADLTKVEKKILEFNKSAEEKMYELLNYYNCSDLALNTAAAMECTFAFNQTFSETGLFRDNINLYPQAYEIKDFSYDAFLRMILSTTTGDSLVGTNDFYGDVVAKSSTTTAILMLVLDILSQYVIPAFKLFLLVALVLSSILLVLVSVVKVDSQMKFLPKLLNEMLLPLLGFMGVTVAFSFIVAMFMGNGNNAVTQSDGMIVSMGDPNTAMIALCALDLGLVFIYFKLAATVGKSVISNLKMSFHFMQGIYGGAIAGIVGVATTATENAISGGRGSGSINEEGTGREALSAASRASGDLYANVIERHEENTRIENTIDARSTVNSNIGGSMNETRRDEISNIINRGASRINDIEAQEMGITEARESRAKTVEKVENATQKTEELVDKL